MPISTSYTNLSDDELLQSFRTTGNNNWLGLLLQRYTLLLLGVAMKYLKDKEQAQDAVQQIFLKSLTHLPEGEIHNFKGWLYVLMRNHCLQILRDRTYLADSEVLNYVPAGEEINIREHLTHDLTLEQMKEALQELQEDQKACVTQFYLQKQSYHQIMEATGFTFAQVKSYIQNGKRNLKLMLIKKMGLDNQS